ncbi:hypothetical protein CCH79_00011682 [Gambusia affinis]|uniref:Uncharacterized protein n=1 Tax=Gambusia affinis TaxID=33528 RepID=A0A315VV60_GAMAF|nr:hypothetical protein CCH79_00011682 [Gambusia affinis]
MGTGDYICVTLRGGAPWGFSLRQGEGDIYRPLLASQIPQHPYMVKAKESAKLRAVCSFMGLQRLLLSIWKYRSIAAARKLGMNESMGRDAGLPPS